MFWGLIMEPHKRYTQIVEKSFHVSMASLDVSTAGSYSGAVQVMMNYENRNYLLCTLQKGTTLQVPLDLNFQEGTKIAFTSNGSGHVHLTGYLVPEEDDFDDECEEEDLEEEEEEGVPQLVGKSSKRKALDILNQSQNSVKRSKHEAEEESSDDDESDEDDSELGDVLKDDELEDEEEDVEDEEVEDEEEEDEEEEEEVVEQPAKKTKQTKQQQQQNKKQEKQKLVNGKDVKQEQKQPENKQDKKIKGEQQTANSKQESKKRVIEGGVQVEDLKVGNGAPAKSGKFVSVYYVGRLKNGKKFDSCNQGEGFKFRLGKKEVIQGWDVGIAGMKIGGKRRITIPPAFAYGAKGSPPVIPPNSVLVFEVELKKVH